MSLRVSIVVLADTDTHEGLGRIANAMEAVKEFKEHGDDVRLIFDGAGVKWPSELASPDHKLHRLYEKVSDKIAGACDYCSEAFGVKTQLAQSNIKLISEFERHPSFRSLIAQGYQVITF